MVEITGRASKTPFLSIVVDEGEETIRWDVMLYTAEVDARHLDISKLDVEEVRTALHARPAVVIRDADGDVAYSFPLNYGQWMSLRALVWPDEYNLDDDPSDELSDLELMAGEDTPRRFRRNEPV